jgi:two-component system NtrC family sensor kinase
MNDAVAGGDEAALRAEIVRLNKVVKALMNRAERDMSTQGSNFGLFQTTVMLEGQVQNRTRELEAALHENEEITRALQHAKAQMEIDIEERKRINTALEMEKEEQKVLIRQLEDVHSQLLQSEKLASIGQLAAGVAHEINNPIGFINANLGALDRYVGALLRLIDAYAATDPLLAAESALKQAIDAVKADVDFAYVREDVGALIAESIDGTARIRLIVQDLRDFSRIGETDWQLADLHAGIDSTLNVVRNEIKYKAEVIREYGPLPMVECIPSQLNQVFMNLLVNAAQAISDRGAITIRTACDGDRVSIAVTDTGSGMAPETRSRIFDPFFTTKPVGAGTGLGLSVSYGIVEKHGGCIEVDSVPGAGSTFTVRLPVQRKAPLDQQCNDEATVVSPSR